MAKIEKQNQWVLIAIVAIVAIVSIVFIVKSNFKMDNDVATGQAGLSSSSQSSIMTPKKIYEQGYAAGIASLGRSLPRNLANTCIGPDGTCDGGSCGYGSCKGAGTGGCVCKCTNPPC